MARSSTTTGSDEALYTTPDLEGRLDPKELVAPRVTDPPQASSDFAYDEATVADDCNPDAELELPCGTRFRGTLVSVSFGKGWLTSVSGHEGAVAFMHAAAKLPASNAECTLWLDGGGYALSGNLDFTVTCGYTFTVTVTADAGDYLKPR